MKKQRLAIAAFAVAAAPALAFGQTYDNGGMDPQPGGCGGNMYSAIEAPSTVYGNNTIVTSYHQADDFTVPSGQVWTPTQLTWYLYQSSSPENEPIVEAFIQLWQGSQADMLAGLGTLVGGDMTTNRLISSQFSGVYRTTATDVTSCTRAVKEVKIDMSWVGNLSEGQYWIEIGSTGNPSYSGPWANHVVPRDGNENSIYFTVGGGWGVNTSGGVFWDYPFKLEYTGGGGGYTCNITGACPGNIDVNWAGAQPNKTQGIIFASNTGNYTVNFGACSGTQLGLGTRNLQLVRTLGTGSGSGSIGRSVNSGACGGFVQLVTVGSPCEASTVGQIP